MSHYCSLLPLEPPLDREGVQRLFLHACLDIHQVDWLRCFLATDGGKMLCWYQAADAESVRMVLRQQESGEAPVWPAEVSDVTRGAPTAEDKRCVVLQFDREESDPTLAEIIDVLSAADYAVSCSFGSSDNAHLAIVVEGEDESAINDRLHAAGMSPDVVWPCMEIDPQPPKLFEASGHSGGLARDHSASRSVRTEAEGEFDALIIGAGISGICAMHRLVEMGLRVRTYEAASDVGGVWHWNRYPGARVDSESYTYLFSFSNELLDEWDWAEVFSPQPEIEQYLKHVVDRFDLRRHIRFDTRIRTANYDEGRRLWTLTTDAGEQVSARFLVAATGTLSAPQLPDIPGMDDFGGESHHTGRWPEAGVDLGGKRVGVVGTGASGVQVIQTIAGDVEQLTVFQRTPTYCIPQRNRTLTDEDRRRIRDEWKDILATCRESYGGFIHTFDPRSGLSVSEEERDAKFEELWQIPGFAFWFGNFGDLMMNREVNESASDFVRGKIREVVQDPDVVRKLLPDHPFGAKRVPLENGYYEVYNRNNVQLVDLRETPIDRITASGIRTTQEEHPLDIIVYATGYDAGTGALTRMDVRGVDGVTLAEKWRDGPRTFLGLLVSGFPNLFIVNGPQNAAGLCNAGRCIEQNVSWIAGCIERMRTQGLTRIAASAEAEEEWTRHVDDVADASVLRYMTDSWFFGANTPGKARRVNIYAAGAREYREHCQDVANAGYPGCTMI
jgi:cation diffusion facilitator CzcD-associated flavoprotein CzcO